MATTPARVLITGSRGQLAGSLQRLAPAHYEIIGLERADLDITDADAVGDAVAGIQPQVILNAAAYNLVDKAETEGARAALEINALGVAVLAGAAKTHGARLVHFSTDFVLDGRKRTPYVETDCTGPLGVYGSSKLCGENIALAAHPSNLAIRVCRLFGPVNAGGSGSAQKPSGNFPSLMLRLARERGKVRVVGDQVGSPSYTPDLAVATWELLEKSSGGLYHLSNEGEVDFASYAEEIFRMAGVSCAVERVSSAEYGAPANRPLYSTLSNAKAHACGVRPLRHWREALAEYLESPGP